jgi:hypothetical protein
VIFIARSVSLLFKFSDIPTAALHLLLLLRSYKVSLDFGCRLSKEVLAAKGCPDNRALARMKIECRRMNDD